MRYVFSKSQSVPVAFHIEACLKYDNQCPQRPPARPTYIRHMRDSCESLAVNTQIPHCPDFTSICARSYGAADIVHQDAKYLEHLTTVLLSMQSWGERFSCSVPRGPKSAQASPLLGLSMSAALMSRNPGEPGEYLTARLRGF